MALGATSRRPQASEAAQYQEPPPEGIRIGIALSGGGIRSAAFNLGALQALRETGILERAEYLAAVSGGNYIGSALTISHAFRDPDHDDGKPPWSAGSAEERYLRNNTDYIAPGWTGRVWLGLSVVYGFALNYLPFLLSAMLVGNVTGWALHRTGLMLDDLRFTGIGLPPSWALRILLVALCCCVGVAVVLVFARRFRDGYVSVGDYGRSLSERIAAWMVGAALLIVVTMALPALAGAYAAASQWVLPTLLGADPRSFYGPAGRFGIAAAWLVAALVVAVAALVLGRRVRARWLITALSAISGAALFMIPLLSSLEYAARSGIRSFEDVAPSAVALVVVVLMGVFVHNRRYSLHLFYRERLNSAFALIRRRTGAKQIVAEPLPYGKQLLFSDIGKRLDGVALPKLIVCCAVNITTDAVPSGRYAESFTFTHELSGSPLFGYNATGQFETRRGPAGTVLTLPSLMAVSGAALSPLMGRFTYPPMRFLMALMNIRLGVWVPSPLNQHWNDPPPDTSTWWRRARQAVVDGWHEPGAYYVLREALGVLRPESRYVYLSDGGHWENLGLVEVLRRNCTHVLSFDASGDTTGAGQDLGRAIALARSDLGVEIELDPRPTIAGAAGLAADVAARGVIKYPDRREAKIVYAKAVLTEDTSWDLHAFRERDPLFPNHPTSQQMFTNEQFEAYRALGHAAGMRAVVALNPTPALLGPTGSANGSTRSMSDGSV